MPIKFNMVPFDGFIRETWSGDIEIRDLREYWARMLRDEACLAVAKTLVDIRRATLLFSDAELLAAIQEVGLPLLGNRVWTSALVVRRSRQLLVAGRYQGFAATFSRDSIFSEIEEAERWLLKQDHRAPSRTVEHHNRKTA